MFETFFLSVVLVFGVQLRVQEELKCSSGGVQESSGGVLYSIRDMANLNLKKSVTAPAVAASFPLMIF